MTDKDLEGFVDWLRSDIKELFGVVDELKGAVTRQSARCDAVCNAVAERERSRERVGDRWWGLVFRLMGQAVAGAGGMAGAGLGLLYAAGKWPW